jgi:hypothetical protein
MRIVAHTTETHRTVAGRASSLRRLVEQEPSNIGAGRPSVGGRRTAPRRGRSSQHRRGLPVLWRSAHGRLSSDSSRRPNGCVCSTVVPSLKQATKACGTRAGTCSVSPPCASLPVRGVGAFGHAVKSTLRALGVVVPSRVRPNPSVEGTHNGGARLLASATSAAPSCAPHVKR